MKNRFNLTIFFFVLFSIVLITGRIIWTGNVYYIFLVWNLFLALVPYWISNHLKKQEQLRIRHTPALAIWLLFIPNSPYILTDYFHLHKREGVPLWFDLVLVSSFAIIGLVIFFRSTADIYTFLKTRLTKLQLRLIAPIILWLIAFGLYLGRYGRFNSWDIVQHPFGLARRSMHLLSCKDTIAFTCIFSVFIYLVYLTLFHFNSKASSDD